MKEIIILSAILFTSIILIPLFFVVWPPKKINGLYGYRTPRSMKNQKNWDAAQRYSSRLLLKFSIISFLLFLILLLFLNPGASFLVAIGVWMIGALTTIMFTEMYLKNL